MTDVRNDGQAALLPFYLVADVSYSMTPEMGSLNDAMLDLHNEISTDPVVADKTRFSIITFSDQAKVVLPMCDLGDIDEIPVLKPEGNTSYSAAFNLLRQQIDKDVDQLKADGFRVFRPAVFFFSDGSPTEGGDVWKPAVATVHDAAWPRHPNIITFGLGGVDEQVIGAIATLKAFKAHQDGDAGNAIKEFARALTKSIVKSGRSEGNRLIPPSKIEGADEIDAGIDLDEV